MWTPPISGQVFVSRLELTAPIAFAKIFASTSRIARKGGVLKNMIAILVFGMSAVRLERFIRAFSA
jgi:hypothetical protein